MQTPNESSAPTQAPRAEFLRDSAYACTPVVLITLVCLWCTRYVGVMPDYDYWADLGQMLTAHGFHMTLGTIYSLNNDHIVALPKLIFVANTFVTGGDDCCCRRR